MKTKLFLSTLVFAGLTIFVSCEKDPEPLTQEQAVTKLESVSTEYTDVRSDVESLPVSQVENTLWDLNLPIYDLPTSKSSAKSPIEITKSLKSITSKQDFLKTFGGEDFMFEEWVGTWTYNNGTQTWDHSTTPTDKIIITFPHPSSNATNNATFTYFDYTTTQTLGGPLMTGLKAKLELNGTKIWDWAFKATYSLTNINFQTTTSTDIYSFSDEFDFTSSNETKWGIKAIFTVKKNGDVIFKLYNSATYNVLANQEIEATVEAKVTVKSIEFRFKLTFNSTDIYDTQTDPNDFITMSIWTTSGAKVADLVYKLNISSYEWELWIQFTNGEEALAETYLGELLSEVDLFWDLFDIDEGGY